MVNSLVPSAAKQQFRLAVESQFGVLPGAPAWRRLSDVKAIPSATFETDPFIASGDSAPSLVVLNDDYTTYDVTGRASYSGLMYILSSIFGPPTSVLTSGGTYTHTWTWDGTTELYPVSYVVDYGDTRTAGARRTLGSIFNGLSMGASRTGMDFGSNLLAKDLNTIPVLGGITNERQTVTITGTPTGGAFTLSFAGRTLSAIPYNVTAAALQTLLDGVWGVNVLIASLGPLPGTGIAIDFTGPYGGRDIAPMTFTHTLTGGTSPTPVITTTTPGADASTLIPAVPIFPLHGDIFIDSSWALAQAETTKMLAIYNYGLDVGDRFARTMPINSLKTSDAFVEAEDQEHTVSLQFGADAVADANLANIRSGLPRFVRSKFVGGLTGDAANRYTAIFDQCVYLTGTDGYESANGVHVSTWNGRLGKDSLGNCFRAQLVNRQATL